MRPASATANGVATLPNADAPLEEAPDRLAARLQPVTASSSADSAPILPISRAAAARQSYADADDAASGCGAAATAGESGDTALAAPGVAAPGGAGAFVHGTGC